MMKSIFNTILGVLLCCSMMVSCVEEQDFGQYDDLRITPEVEASMLYIEAPESLVNAAGNVNVISRNFNFDAFSSDIFATRVLDGSITYIVENTTSKAFDFEVEFLDADGNVLDVESFPAPVGQDFQRIVQYGGSGKSIDIIKNTSSLQVTAINQDDTTTTSSLPDPKIILKSSGRFRLNIK